MHTIQRWLRLHREARQVCQQAQQAEQCRFEAAYYELVEELKSVFPEQRFDGISDPNLFPGVAIDTLLDNLITYEIRISHRVFEKLWIYAPYADPPWSEEQLTRFIEPLVISDGQWEKYRSIDPNLHQIRFLLIDRLDILRRYPARAPLGTGFSGTASAGRIPSA